MKEHEGEDVMVDVVGSDPVEEDDHVVSMQKETENCDQDNMVDVVGLGEGEGEDCDASGGIRVLTSEINKEEVVGSGETRVLTSEKDEVTVNEEDMVDVTGFGEDCGDSLGIRVLASEKDEVAASAEDCNALVEARVLTSEKVEVTVNEEDMVDVVGFGEDNDDLVETRVLTSEKDEVVVSKEVAGHGEDCNASVETTVLTSEKVEVIVNEQELEKSEDVKKLHVESVEEVLTTNLGSQEDEMVVEDPSVDPSLVCDNNQSSAAEVVSSRTDEVDEMVKEDSLPSTVEVITDDAQKTTDADHVVNEKIENENEVVVSSKISESLVTVNPSSEDADVVAKEDIPVDPTIEVTTETDAIVNKETEAGFTKKEAVMEKPTEPVQEVVYENGVMDDKTGEEKEETVDSSKIPESLITVNLGPEEVNTAPPITDADMDRGDDAGMDIDEVMGWKDEVTPISVNSEANVEQKLPEPSSEPVLIEHREEHIKSREPIVYGRRAHVEVPLYESLDVDQKLSESSSPVSEDENLKIETDSEQDDDDDNESVQEDDQKVTKQKPRLYKNGSLFTLHQMSYFKPPETEGDFSVSDLVWGKVRSHPWWPGQIIDPSGASKKAMKYYKKDTFLVAYFGDHSFAWNSPSVLTPFRANFSQYANQTNTEIFKTAVDCALDEVRRRVELGLACSCIAKEIYKKIEYQVTENGGVKKKSSKIHGKDESALVSSFEPDKLVDYVRLLAQFPDEGDKLDLSIAKAQLTSYGRYNGHRELTEFSVCGDMLEEQEASVFEPVEQVNKDGEKIENDLIDIVNPNKEISLSDITDDAPAPARAPITAPESVGGTSKSVSSSGLKKRKARVLVSNGSVKKQGRVSNKVSTAPVSTPTPKPSFKIGEMIQRVASQLTGPPSVIKSGSDPKADHGQQIDQTVQTPENSQVEASVADMLSQLHLTAQDPMKEHGFFQTIIPFFYERRAAVFSKSLKKPPTVETPDDDVKLKPPNENEPEEFEFDFDFDDVNDSYWTDRIIQNHSEDQPMQDNQDDQNGAVEEYQIVEHEPEKPTKRRRQSNKKEKSNKKERSIKKEKRAASSNHKAEPEPEPVPEEPEIVRKRRENLATEVVLKFEEGINFRSEVQLNKMFRRFGPLMESETEVDRAGGRARVVFKKCSDAEVAHNSAGQINIFGSVNVSYELNYSPLVSYKPLPLLLPVLQEDLQPVLQQDSLQVQEDPIPMPQEDLHRMLQEEPLQVLQEDPVPVLQEDQPPVLQVDPHPVTQEDPVPMLQEEPVPVLQEDLVPMLREDPVPLLQEDPVPMLQEEPILVLQEEPLLVLQEEPHPVLQEDPHPVLQEDPHPVLQEDPMDAS